MEANELKIGNWVKHNDLTSGSEYPNTEFQIELDHFHDLATSSLLIGSLDPIPLDESWLIRAGFEKVIGTNLYKKPIHEIAGQKLKVLIVYLDGDKYTVAVADYYTGLEKTDLFHMDYEFVHQLQNLFFALTGTELQFAEE